MKYPRTFHLPFSPEIHSDDKTISDKDVLHFINKDIVITEKLDWWNTCMNKDWVFARSHSEIASHRSFDTIKSIWAEMKENIPDGVSIYGENLTGIHSIEYTDLKSYIYLFSVLKDNETFLWWQDIELLASKLNIPTVPVKFKGQFKSVNELKKFLDSEILKPSILGWNCEWFVIRAANQFDIEDTWKSIVKYVRKGHVQTDQHWSKNWKQAKIKRD